MSGCAAGTVMGNKKRFSIVHELPHRNPNHVKELIHNLLLGGTVTESNLTKAWLALRMPWGAKGLDFHLAHQTCM